MDEVPLYSPPDPTGEVRVPTRDEGPIYER